MTPATAKRKRTSGLVDPLLWWLGALVLALAAIIVAGVYLVTGRSADGILETADADPKCDIQVSACSARFASGGRVELSISPRPAKPATPFDVTVTVHDLAPSRVQVDVRGEGMDMGFNRPQLADAGQGRFQGRVTLSVCTLERMYWRATVLLTTDDGVLAAPFRFETTQ